jgi:carboxymethylenebutenolidase
LTTLSGLVAFRRDFHGAGLVTDQPNSPHLQASKTKAQFLARANEVWEDTAPLAISYR